MPIDSIAAVGPVSPTSRIASVQQAAIDRLRAGPPQQQPRQPFEPAPALRPTIQDKIEIDRALLALRAL